MNGPSFKKFQLNNIFLFISMLITLALACHDQPQKLIPSAAMQQKDTTAKRFTAAMVDNKMDPNCGMPVTAGIADTIHYNGKIYGFCSEECKQAFRKNPVVLAKNAQLK